MDSMSVGERRGGVHTRARALVSHRSLSRFSLARSGVGDGLGKGLTGHEHAEDELGSAAPVDGSEEEASDGGDVVEVRGDVVVDDEADEEVVGEVAEAHRQRLGLQRARLAPDLREGRLPVDEVARVRQGDHAVHDGHEAVAEVAAPFPEKNQAQDKVQRE